MLSEGERNCTVTETGKSTYSVHIEVSGHSIIGDETVSIGGANLGPSPYNLLLAALGECTAMTVRWYAVNQGWNLDKVEVKLAHLKRSAGDGKGMKDYFSKEVTLIGDKLTPQQRNKLIEVAARCPVQRTLEGTPIIKTVEAK